MFEGVGRMVKNIVLILVGLILIGIIVPNIDTLLAVFSSSSNTYYGTQIYLLIPLFLGVGLLAYAGWDTYQAARAGRSGGSRRTDPGSSDAGNGNRTCCCTGHRADQADRSRRYRALE